MFKTFSRFEWITFKDRMTSSVPGLTLTLWILRIFTHLQAACRGPPYGLTVNVYEVTDYQMLQIRWDSIAAKHIVD